ncbi:MAG: 1-deoxy-D-xylulose-5-phosphate reductoisomerase [Hyphomicrobiales bacterium]|nr:1-deoxy-D-xylulose-5-phosphate reductoisomerase [Hyphomicrobiales bacterium]
MAVNGVSRIVLLGATGSIGASTIDIVEQTPDAFRIEAVASGRDVAGLAQIARRVGARFAAVRDETLYGALKDALSGSGIEAGAGSAAVVEAALHPADIVVGAISGAAGVEPTYAALAEGRTIALANKECLVCAGAPFMRTAAQMGATILPLDSEHDALWQALGGASPHDVEKLIITASGGPFRTWKRDDIARATREQALKHPNWSMGQKITIDSASMMNKGLELIEAHHLFGVAPDKLDVLVHPQSIVHGLVAFSDGAVTASLYAPDMRVPIAHCLGHPRRLTTNARRLDLAEIASLTFERPDFDRFPALRVAIDALRAGGAMPTVLNAANEIAVEAFLAGRIGFGQIAEIVEEACAEAARDSNLREPATIGEALAVDHIARERRRTVLAGRGGSGKVTFQ